MISMAFVAGDDFSLRSSEVLCSVKKGKPELRKKVLKGVWGPSGWGGEVLENLLQVFGVK